MSSRTSTVTLCLVLGLCGCQGKGTGAALDLASGNDDQKTLYTLGVMLGRNVERFKLTDEELRYVAAGLADGAQAKPPRLDLDTYGKRLPDLEQRRLAVQVEPELAKGRAFADKAAQEPGAERLPSGLVFKTLTAGKGATPAPTDQVAVHYRGTLVDGTEFDSSYKRGQPVNFGLSQVVPCWTEGVQRIKVGGKAQLVCPAAIAYGNGGRPPAIPGGATLVFEVELLAIAPPQQAAPGAAARE